MTFLPREEVLSIEEYIRLAKIFVRLGVQKIRITGGEPMIRKGFLFLVQELGLLPLKDLVMTTNGSQLSKYAKQLKQYGLNRLNISLDSLDAKKFKQLTRVGNLQSVLDGIFQAKEQGFDKIRLNVVLLKGRNDDELFDLLTFAIQHQFDIAFIEEMPLGMVAHDRSQTFVDNDHVLDLLHQRFSLKKSDSKTGGPAEYWDVLDTETKVGLISPHSHNFCDTCNRVRITAKGELFFCLGQEAKIDLLPLLRNNPDNDQVIEQSIIEKMLLKPMGHDFNLSRPSVVRFMSHTGG